MFAADEEAGESILDAYAVHIRHLNIHQNQIKLHLFRPIHRLMSAITKLYVLDFYLPVTRR